MPARCGLAAATDSQNIYAFGGKNEDTRFNDLWKFNLKNYKYERMEDDGNVPAVRNGHTMDFFNDRLYIFGGIHDITWELDDLHIYHLIKKTWTTLEQDSPRKIERK
jgi:N-acetylneuraminic acid mutarotase